MNKNIFEKEISICRENSPNGGCKWGRCQDCGVVPLLYKLCKDELIEDASRLAQIRKENLCP